MNNEQLNKILMKADDDLQALKDRCHELYEENERLNKELNNKEFIFVGTAQNKTRDFIKNLIKEKNDYKSRCEKAIEYIEEMLYPIGSCVNGSDLPYESIESLLNILQNGSDKSEN